MPTAVLGALMWIKLLLLVKLPVTTIWSFEPLNAVPRSK